MPDAVEPMTGKRLAEHRVIADVLGAIGLSAIGRMTTELCNEVARCHGQLLLWEIFGTTSAKHRKRIAELEAIEALWNTHMGITSANSTPIGLDSGDEVADKTDAR